MMQAYTDERIRVEVSYRHSQTYNASGKAETYQVDLPESTADAFHQLYYYGPHSQELLSWMGFPIQKYPTDLLIYQEIIWRLKPDLIVETGTYAGGSALYLAHLLEIIGKGWVMSIDVKPQPLLPHHKRIEYLTGDSVDPEVVRLVRKAAKDLPVVLVILDSDHRMPHVFSEMKAYGPIVTQDSYLIVEDSDINGHPVRPDFGPGPYEAIQKFLEYKVGQDFTPDRQMQRLLLTANKNGYLRKR